MSAARRHPERCDCAECRELDALPVERQGWPGAFQLRLPVGKGKRRGKDGR